MSTNSTADYRLTLSVSALSGSLCGLVLTSLCYNVSVSALCEAGADCYQLVSADDIICRRGSKKSLFSIYSIHIKRFLELQQKYAAVGQNEIL